MFDDGGLSLILDTDSYKFSHWRQYPPGTEAMSSYLESRGGAYTHTVFFGLQYLLRRYLGRPVTKDQVDEADAFAKEHGVPFNRQGWEYIVDRHSGMLPVTIRAVPEGSVVPISNVLMTVDSTDPRCFWVVSWLETMLMRLWYPTTVATVSWGVKQTIYDALKRTADDPNAEIGFKLHDFGSRGVSSRESAMLGGAAHLVNFLGSDTIAGIWCANKYYGTGSFMAGFSIPAAEHSTITAWGKDGEEAAYRNMLAQYADYPIIACVSDSWDVFNAARSIWGDRLLADVKGRNGLIVIRPDSGNPVAVVRDLLTILDERFGSARNSKGYKVLNHVRVIQGDGVNPDSIRQILDAAIDRGFSATNLAFGMGGALLQKCDRDTMKFAFKCSHVSINGNGVDVYKDPVTDKGKMSKRGRLDLNDEGNGRVQTVRYPAMRSLMLTYYDNGLNPRIEDNLITIRERTKVTLRQFMRSAA